MRNRKVVLITGASSGIGHTTADLLNSHGYRVYGAARRTEKMKDLKKKGVEVIKLDVTDDSSVHKCVKKVLREEGRIDVLVNNAGYGLYGTVEETTLEDARHQFEVNLFGLARMTQLVLPQMRKQKSGLIVNISSIAGKLYTPLGAWYHASKHGVEGFSDCLRFEVEPFGIKVVIIEPGLIKTEFSDVMINPLIKRSGSGPYKKLVKSLELTSKKVNKANFASNPSVIADTILKAIETKNPKTRYPAGKYSKISLLMRKLLPDKLFDMALSAQLKKK